MARERIVTRTVELTIAEVMTLDTTTAKVETIAYEVVGGLTEEKAVLKAVKKLHETDTFKCVAVQSISTKEILYGMAEIDFIKYAKVLPPRKSNDVDSNEENED